MLRIDSQCYPHCAVRVAVPVSLDRYSGALDCPSETLLIVKAVSWMLLKMALSLSLSHSMAQFRRCRYTFGKFLARLRDLGDSFRRCLSKATSSEGVSAHLEEWALVCSFIIKLDCITMWRVESLPVENAKKALFDHAISEVEKRTVAEEVIV